MTDMRNILVNGLVLLKSCCRKPRSAQSNPALTETNTCVSFQHTHHTWKSDSNHTITTTKHDPHQKTVWITLNLSVRDRTDLNPNQERPKHLRHIHKIWASNCSLPSTTSRHTERPTEEHNPADDWINMCSREQVAQRAGVTCSRVRADAPINRDKTHELWISIWQPWSGAGLQIRSDPQHHVRPIYVFM